MKLGFLNRPNSSPAFRDDQQFSATPDARLRLGVLGALALLGPVLLFFAYYRTMFPGLLNPDAMDFAQLGRNLGSGQGFVTYLLRPLALNYGPHSLAQPDLTHGPLYPFILALAFGIIGANDSTVALVSGLFYLLTIPVVYGLGKRLFNHTVGLITVLIFACNALILEYAASGLHITLYLFLTTSLFLVMYDLMSWAGESENDASHSAPRGKVILAGALTGALYLTDPVFACLIPVMTVAFFRMRPLRRPSTAAGFLIPLMALTLPWMGRNWALTGNPIFGLQGQELLMGTNTYPGTNAYRMLPGDMIMGAGLYLEVLKKIVLNFNHFTEGFPQIAAIWVLAFFPPTLFFRFRDPATNQLRALLAFSFLGILLVTVLLTFQLPLFVALLPVILVFAVGYLIYMIQQVQLSRPAIALVASVFTFILVLPLLTDTQLNRKPEALKSAESARQIGRALKRDEVILTDQPWVTAWYGNRRSLWLPVDSSRLVSLKKQVGPIKGLFLTETAPSYGDEWAYIYTIFNQWNEKYVQVPLNQRSQISPPQIKAKGVSRNLLPQARYDLVQNLDGFAWIPPVEKTPTTVMAAVSSPGKRLSQRNVPETGSP